MLIGKRFKNRSTTRHRIIIARIQITIIKIKLCKYICQYFISKKIKKTPCRTQQSVYIQKYREQKKQVCQSCLFNPKRVTVCIFTVSCSLSCHANSSQISKTIKHKGLKTAIHNIPH